MSSPTATTSRRTAPRPGSPRAAFASRAFRWVFLGTFASNIGTWMQNVALLAFADQLTHDATFVGIVTMAQLGPMLVLSPIGGVLADRFDRKVLMIGAATVQASMSAALAFAAMSDDPSLLLIVMCVLGIGIASAINGPAAQATTPALVGRENLAGAVAVNSAQMNASRVLGPILALIPFLETPSTVFFVNASTYVFVIAAIALVKFDSKPPHDPNREAPIRQFIAGVRAAKANKVVGRGLATVSIYSLFSLAYIYQMAGFSREELGLAGQAYRLLFGTFGLGAALGAIAVGTRLAQVDRTILVRVGLGGFAVSLAVFGLAFSTGVAFVSVGLSGFFYFIVITALSTAIQHEVEEENRGRVMGLWMMGWAGLVPVGSLLAGLAIDRVGFGPVFVAGAVVAAALIPFADLDATRRPPSAQGRRFDSPSPAPLPPETDAAAF
ncbi:MAG: MFS transporter [Microthrixaceae bacterium]